MKKSVFLACLSIALSSSAFAQVKGSAEVTASYANVTQHYPNSNIQSASMLLDLEDGHKLGLSATSVNAWGGHARYYNVRWVAPFEKDQLWFDSNIGGSDQDKVTARTRVNTTLNYKAPGSRWIWGVGVDAYDMRQSGSARGIKVQSVYYVPGMPLVLQGDVAYSESSFNSRPGHRVGVAATYGRVGQWTTSVSLDTGRVHYELERQPGTIADYNSTHLSTGLRYWMAPDWGISTNFSHVNNKHYIRNEIRGGVFWSF